MGSGGVRIAHKNAQGTRPILCLGQRIGRVTLQARLRSVDRTKSPASFSKKREFFERRPETIANSAQRMAKIGAWRLKGNSQRPPMAGLSTRIGDPLSEGRTAWLGWEDSNLEMAIG